MRQLISTAGRTGFRTLLIIIFWSFSLLAICSVCGNGICAQEPDDAANEEKQITVKVNVDEVRIDAVVVDWRGRYLTDLTAEDFEIYQDGQPLEITSCKYISYDQEPFGSDAGAVRENPDLPMASTSVLKQEDVRRTLVFLVDTLNMGFINAYYARMSLRKYVDEQMKPGDLVAILTTSKGYLGPLAFTSDKKLLDKSIQNVQKDSLSMDEIDPYQCDAAYEHLLASIRYFNQALQNMPGHKSLILMSTKTRLPIVENAIMSNAAASDEACEARILRRFNELAVELQHTGVVFHTMDIRGLMADAGGTDVTGNEGMALPLSAKTGGLFLENDNFFVNGIGELEEALKGYYLLTYVPPAGTFTSDGSEISHKIEIKSKRWMSEVRHRDQNFKSTTIPGTVKQSEDPLLEAVISPFQNNDLPIELSSGYIKNTGGDSLLQSWLHLDGEQLEVIEEAGGNRHVAVEVLGMISDINSRIWDEGRQVYTLPVREDELQWVRENGLSFSIDIPAKDPGAYYVRVAVKDEGSGKQGSAYQYVEVPDLKKDRLALSDIFILRGQGGEAKLEGVRAALKPYMPGETIGFRTEIYNAKTKKGKLPELEYRYVLYKDMTEVLQNGPIKIDTGRLSDYDKIPLIKELKLSDSIEPGMYTLQLEVRDTLAKEKDSIATRWLNFEIAADVAEAYLQSGEELLKKALEAEQEGNRDEMIAAFEEAAGMYRKALQKHPDSAAASKGLEDVAHNIRESLKRLQGIQDYGEVRKNEAYWLMRATEWREAVENHKPGMLDEAAVTIGDWPAIEMLTIHYLTVYEASRKNGNLHYETSSFLSREFRDKDFTFHDIVPSLELEPDREYVLRRAGLLYSDIALLKLDTGVRENVDSRSILIVDGRSASQDRTFYWDLARQVLEVTSLESEPDPFIRHWFAASTAYLLGQRLFSHADPNLQVALDLFPSDPQFLFYTGVLHESYAAPLIQNARELNTDGFPLDSRKSELKDARKYFEKSVEADPNFFEGWLHLGRVRGLLGDHKRAIEELKKAAEGLTDRQLRYYCALFLGDELSEMGRPEEARMQYELASTLYPSAQAPLLGLSQLDRVAGNFESALTEVKKVFALSAEEAATKDPLQVYEIYPARYTSALLSAMYTAIRGQVQ